MTGGNGMLRRPRLTGVYLVVRIVNVALHDRGVLIRIHHATDIVYCSFQTADRIGTDRASVQVRSSRLRAFQDPQLILVNVNDDEEAVEVRHPEQALRAVRDSIAGAAICAR